MAVPRVLWIRHLADTPTSNIGSFTGLRERLQFFGSVLGFPSGSTTSTPSVEAAPARRWQAVLHRFRFSGVYVGTDAWVSPEGLSEKEGLLVAREHLAGWLSKLHGISYQDIHIRPFTTTIAGARFGLLKSKQGLLLTLQPNCLSFHAPWAGDYDESPLAVSA